MWFQTAERIPGKFPNKLLIWFKVRVCEMSPGPGTKMPKFLGTRNALPQAPWLGRSNVVDQAGQANPFQVFGISSFVSLIMFRIAKRGRCQLQPH